MLFPLRWKINSRSDTNSAKRVMEQLQKQQPVAITVTHTIEKTTTVVEGEIPALGIVCEVSSASGNHSPPRPSSTAQSLAVSELYTLVRLSELAHWKDGEIQDNLDRELIENVAGITALKDGSFEMVVLVAYLPTLQDKLNKKFPGSKVDPSHAPYDVQEIPELCCFLQRAECMVKNAWPTAGVYYSHLQAQAIAGVQRSMTHWECHKCSAGMRIEEHSKVCRNKDCRHEQCKQCFYLSGDSKRVLYCNGACIRDRHK